MRNVSSILYIFSILLFLNSCISPEKLSDFNFGGAATGADNEAADLVTVKSVDKSQAAEGDNLTYTIEVTNNGSVQATNVSLTDLCPTGTTYISSSSTGGSYLAATGLWTLATPMANGSNQTLSLVCNIDAGQGGETIKNTATAASGDQSDPSTDGDDTDSETDVDNEADLVTVKTSTNEAYAEGDDIRWIIEVTNNGPAMATNVSLTDLCPMGTTYTNDNPSQGLYSASSGLWSIGDINSGSTVNLVLECRVDMGQAGNVISNSATPAQGDQDDPTGDGDDTDDEITVTDVDLESTISVEDATCAERQVKISATITNSGADPATGVLINLPCPPSMAFVNAIPGTGSYAAPTWTIGTLAPGATANIDYFCQPPTSSNTYNFNVAITTADITLNEGDSDISNDASSDIGTVQKSVISLSAPSHYQSTNTVTNINYPFPGGINNDRGLIVMTGHDFSVAGDLTSMSYGGQPMVQLAEGSHVTSGYDTRGEIWFLNEAGLTAAVGTTLNINVTPISGSVWNNIVVLALDNIDQVAPLLDIANSAGPSGPPNQYINNLNHDLDVADCGLAVSVCTFGHPFNGNILSISNDPPWVSQGDFKDPQTHFTYSALNLPTAQTVPATCNSSSRNHRMVFQSVSFKISP